jgi:hypothetical protein
LAQPTTARTATSCSRGIGDSAAGLTANRIYGLDLIEGGRLTKPVETEALKPAQGERIGVDLDENGTPFGPTSASSPSFRSSR